MLHFSDNPVAVADPVGYATAVAAAVPWLRSLDLNDDWSCLVISHRRLQPQAEVQSVQEQQEQWQQERMLAALGRSSACAVVLPHLVAAGMGFSGGHGTASACARKVQGSGRHHSSSGPWQRAWGVDAAALLAACQANESSRDFWITSSGASCSGRDDNLKSSASINCCGSSNSEGNGGQEQPDQKGQQQQQPGRSGATLGYRSNAGGAALEYSRLQWLVREQAAEAQCVHALACAVACKKAHMGEPPRSSSSTPRCSGNRKNTGSSSSRGGAGTSFGVGGPAFGWNESSQLALLQQGLAYGESQSPLPAWLRDWLQAAGCTAIELLGHLLGNPMSNPQPHCAQDALDPKGLGLGEGGVEVSGLSMGGVHSIESSGRLVPTLVLQELAVKHYLQLALPLMPYQEELCLHSCYARGEAEVVAAAAAVLQTGWRARCERLSYQKLRDGARDGGLVDAAVCLQAAWRGRVVRKAGEVGVLRRAAAAALEAAAVAAQEEQKMEMQRAAVVMIQAAVRGHGVRRRLKAALEAARKVDCREGCAEKGEAAVGGALGRSWSFGESWEAEEGEGAWWHAPEKLLGGQFAGGGSVKGAAASVGVSGAGAAMPVAAAAAAQETDEAQVREASTNGLKLQRAQEKSAPAAVVKSAGGENSSKGLVSSKSRGVERPAGSSITGDSSGEDEGMGQGESEAGSPSRKSNPNRREAYEAKLKAMMVEWGFKDMATAEMHYK